MKPIFSDKPASNDTSGINHAMLVRIVQAIESSKFSAHPNVGKLYVKQFLKMIVSLNIVPPKKMACVKQVKAAARLIHL